MLDNPYSYIDRALEREHGRYDFAVLDIHAEATPHHFTLTEEACIAHGTLAKMNPPLRTEEDRMEIIRGLQDGTIDMIATDHAPHSAEEKSKGFKGSLNGIVGLETAFPVIYTNFVKKGIFSFEWLVKIMSDNPRKIFNIPTSQNDGILVEIDTKHTIDKETFRTLGRSMPYDGMEVYGKCLATFINGRMVR